MRITTSKGRVLLEREGELGGRPAGPEIEWHLSEWPISRRDGSVRIGPHHADLEDADLSEMAARRRNPGGRLL